MSFKFKGIEFICPKCDNIIKGTVCSECGFTIVRKKKVKSNGK